MNDAAPPREAVIGDNSGAEPSYAEQMLAGSLPQRDRATLLIEALNDSSIDSPETLDAVTTLGNLIAAHKGAMDATRKELKKPWDDGAAAVQGAYQPTIKLLDDAVEVAKGMIDGWNAHLAALAREEQRKRDEEAAAARRVAEEAQAKQREAEAAGDTKGALDAELAALQATEAAKKIDTAPPTVQPGAMIRTQAGSAGARTERVPVIDDLRKCVAALHKGHRQALLDAVKPVVDRLTRAKVPLDGVSVVEQQKTVFRR